MDSKRNVLSLVFLLLLMVVWLPSLACGPRSAATPLAPYPIPSTPTRQPTPTPPVGATPTFMLKPTPAPTPTQTPFPTGPTRTPAPPTPTIVLPPSPFQMIWAESVSSREMPPGKTGITFFQGDPGRLHEKKVLATMSAEYTLSAGRLSPDGQKIAFTTYPTAFDHKYMWLGTLWVMNRDGSDLKKLADGIVASKGSVFEYPIWSADSRALTYIKSIAKPSPTPGGAKEEVSYTRYEYHTVAIDSSVDVVLFTEDREGMYISLLGYSVQNTLLYSLWSTGKPLELWQAAAAGGSPRLVTSLPKGMGLQLLSPDRSKLIYGSEAEGVGYMSVDGKERKWLDLKGAPRIIGWSSNPAEVIVGDRWGYGWANYKAINIHTGVMRDIAVPRPPADTEDDFLSVSPNEGWMAVASHPTGLNALKVGSDIRIQVAGNVYYVFFGWTASGE